MDAEPGAASALVWVLADDRPGNANQALGVAEALGWPFVVKTVRYGPLAALPNRVLGASLLGLSRDARRSFVPPWPDLVIAAGRRTAPVARWIKRRHPAAFLVQLMWPGSARGLDLVVVPDHDSVTDDARIMRTLGAPHRLNHEKLQAAAQELALRIAHLPRPRLVCLIGGTSRHGPFTPADARALAEYAARLAQPRGGSLLITTSRRTGKACEDALEQLDLPVPAWLHRFSAGGSNPYLGLLGSADALVVSADSASMCTEACASAKPVFLFRPHGLKPGKLRHLHARLHEEGYLQPLEDARWPDRVPPPLLPQQDVARAIHARLRAATPAVTSGGLLH